MESVEENLIGIQSDVASPTTVKLAEKLPAVESPHDSVFLEIGDGVAVQALGQRTVVHLPAVTDESYKKRLEGIVVECGEVSSILVANLEGVHFWNACSQEAFRKHTEHLVCHVPEVDDLSVWDIFGGILKRAAVPGPGRLWEQVGSNAVGECLLHQDGLNGNKQVVCRLARQCKAFKRPEVRKRFEDEQDDFV